MKRHLLLFLFLWITFTAFSQQTVGLFLNDSLSYNGYTLIAPEYTTTYLIDNCGYVVNTWEADQRPGKSTYLLENGNLLRTGNIPGPFNSGGKGGRIEIYSWEGELLWQYDYASSQFHQHHDVAVLPSGNILLIAWDLHSYIDAVENGRDPALTNIDGVWSERIVELEPVGSDDANIVWQWDLWDHLVQDFDSTKINFGVIADHPELVDINFNGASGGPNGNDWVHANAINYNPELDQIILSSRNFNEFWIIDHSTSTQEATSHIGGNSNRGGDVLYRWGNPITYQNGDIDDRKLYGQHDVQWIPTGNPDEGKIMIFNNGLGRPTGNYSSIDIIDPPMDSAGNYILTSGSPYGPEDLFWTFQDTPLNNFYSSNISGVQRLPNGNTLICEGRKGLLFEIDQDQNRVWEYQNPVRTTTGPVAQETDITTTPVTLFRAYRYGEDYPAFIGKELPPGDPIELNPTPYNCMIHGTFTATKEEQQLENVSIIENPIFQTLRVKNESSETLRIEVIDINGKLISKFSSSDFIIESNAFNWAPGIYIVRIFNPENKFYSAKIVKL